MKATNKEAILTPTQKAKMILAMKKHPPMHRKDRKERDESDDENDQ